MNRTHQAAAVRSDDGPHAVQPRRRRLRTAALGAALAAAAFAASASAQRGGFGPTQQERKVVAQFDRDGNARLDAAERKAAREWLATQPSVGFGRGGFGRGAAADPPVPGAKLSPADVRTYPPSVPLYDRETIRTLFLQFEAQDWEQELAAFNNTDVEVPATVTVDGRTYREVGVHFRGMSSFFMVPEGRKRSLNLSFDFVHDSQVLNGYKTLNLLNANNDPTFLRGLLYTDIASHYIPVPRMNYMRVVINGESWGIYVNAQQFNKDFTRDFFQSTKGARWKVPGSPGGRAGFAYLGDRPDDYRTLYQITSKDDPRAWADLIRMFRVLNETPTDQLTAALSPLLDIDGVLRFLALDVALVNTDGFWTRASDYSLYQDEKGMFHIIPHDVNEGLGVEEGRGRRTMPLPPGVVPGGPGRGFGGPGGFGRGGGPDLDPLVGLDDPGKPLRARLLAVPALRAKYLAYVRDIAERRLDWKTLGPIAQKYHAQLAADVKADTRKIYSTAEFTTGMAALETFVKARQAYLLKTVPAAPASPAK